MRIVEPVLSIKSDPQKAGTTKKRRRLTANCRKAFSCLIVGLTGIEPALPKELDPKSSASASSATAPVEPTNSLLLYMLSGSI